VNECKPLPLIKMQRFTRLRAIASSRVTRHHAMHIRRTAENQGLTPAHFKAQLEDLRDTSLTLELNLSTFGPHPRINMGWVGRKVSFS